MLAVTLARMGVGLITFILLARFLGPRSFGLIATAMAYSTFIGILTDYGLATSAMRKAAADAENAASILSQAVSVKLILTGFLAIVGGIALILLPASNEERTIQMVIFAGVLAFSFGDLALVAARAQRRFDIEAKLVLGTSIGMLLLVGGVAAMTGSALSAAIAFTITRLFYLAAVLTGLKVWLGIAIKPIFDRKRLLSTARYSGTYAVDNLLTTLANQLDVLLFGLILTAHDIGIYQAGSRLVQVIVPFAVVLSSVYLPNLVASLSKSRDVDFGRQSKRMMAEFTGLACLGALGFSFVGPFMGDILYGPAYAALKPLWAGFGIFVVLRFTSAAFGIQLVAHGAIAARIASQLASIAFMALSTMLLLPRYGLEVSSWLLAASAVPGFLLLALAVGQRKLDGERGWWKIAPICGAVASVIIVIIIWWTYGIH